MVELRGACKALAAQAEPVLRNLHMTVRRGSIYGLLGSSGCGKTTVLKCIAGSYKLDSGTKSVLGNTNDVVPPLDIGFMPQETALHNELTVRETFFYFGWIYSMDSESISKSFDSLQNEFQLPPAKSKIKMLSGGEKRRVSFAVTLIHKPQLILLDEPTVGQDPILQESMWDYLRHLTSLTQMTVIFTTHYIEEARKAQMVGLMRNGLLLTEGPPNYLMQVHECSNLEDVFLVLCKKETQSLPVTYSNPIMEQENIPKSSHSSPHLSLGRLKALMLKNFLGVIRNPGFFIFAALGPIIGIISLFLGASGNPTGMTLAVVNQELGYEYKTCKDVEFTGSQDVNFTCDIYFAGCMLLKVVDKDGIIIEYFDEMDNAIAAVADGSAIGAMKIPRNFSKELSITFGNLVGNAEILPDERDIAVYLDMSDFHRSFYMKSKLISWFQDTSEIIAEGCDISKNYVKPPLAIQDPVYGLKETDYAKHMAPAALLAFVYYMASILTSTVLITEKLEGIFNRNAIAGVTGLENVLSHLLSQGILVIIHVIETVSISLYGFGLPCEGSLLLVFTLLILQGMTGMCFGFVISAISKSMTSANIISIGTFFPFMTLTGIIWPIEGMPKPLRLFAYAFPGILPCQALNNILLKGWSLAHSEVYFGFMVTIVWLIGQSILFLSLRKTFL